MSREGAVPTPLLLRRRRLVAAALTIGAAAVGVPRTFGAQGGLVPRRTRLTKTFGSGLVPRPDTFGAAGALPATMLYIFPIEAPCRAVRLGVANPFNIDMVILNASIYSSDSYGHAQLLGAGAKRAAIRPTGRAVGRAVYWDNGGRDVGAVNDHGNKRSFRLAANSANAPNSPWPAKIMWSDFVPCVSIPRADGGMQHLLFVYVTIGSRGFAAARAEFPILNRHGNVNRGRQYHIMRAGALGIDFADDPEGTDWTWLDGGDFGPLWAIQYVAERPGMQVVLSGDSLSAAPLDDHFSTPLHRASWDLSTPSAPIEVASMAWGGTSSSVYEPMLRDNAAALQPSVVAYQPLSRSDGLAAGPMQELLQKALADAAEFRQQYGSGGIWNNAGCEPSADGVSSRIMAFNMMRSRLQELANADGTPLIDAPAVIGNAAAGRPWDYLPGYSDDNTHPNYAGAEAVVPQARSALAHLMSR